MTILPTADDVELVKHYDGPPEKLGKVRTSICRVGVDDCRLGDMLLDTPRWLPMGVCVLFRCFEQRPPPDPIALTLVIGPRASRRVFVVVCLSEV